MKKILEARTLKEKILIDLKKEVSFLDKKLKLSVIRVGENPSSIIFINSKRKACIEVGIDFEELIFSENITEEELILKINELNNDNNITSILVQLPLPEHINSSKVINSIDYRKDVDGLTNANIGKQMNNENGIEACTAKGIINLLKYYNIEIEGKNVVIINRSKLIGRPLIPLMLKENATLTICHSKTKNLSFHTKNADIIIVAVGKPNFLTKEMVNKNSIVIDVGINKLDGKTVGDVNAEVIEYVDYISPVPGGVGLMTVSSVVLNVMNCYKLQN